MPKGSRLREFFAVKDYEPTSFRQWVELVQQFASTLGRRSGGRGSAEGRLLPERGRRAGEDADPETGPQENVDPWSTGEDPWRGGGSQANRLNDFRQTASALRGRGTQARPTGLMPGRGGAAGVPWCGICRGRHFEKVCPNEAARQDTTFSPPVGEREGPVCLYNDPRCPDVVCRGRGHFARHHGQAGGVESRGPPASRFPVRVANGEGAVQQGDDDEWVGPPGELDGANELDEEREEWVGEPASWLGEADDEVRLAGDQGFSPVRVMREAGVEPVRVEHHEEPLPIGSMGRGFNCVVMVTVGTQRFRMTVDTGAARSLIRAKFADQLRRSAKTREAVVRRFQRGPCHPV